MKRFFGIISFLFISIGSQTVFADSEWKNSFALGQQKEWYGSDEAIRIAENVLLYQKETGGWPKNEEMHEVLTESQKIGIEAKKSELSCFDNGATTTEMRYLAKVYSLVPDERYRNAFNQALNCLIEAQGLCGSGWPQYWPKREGGAGTSYSNFITFNDNTIVNILKMLQDVMSNSGDFADITDEGTRQKARESYEKGLQCILDCQIRNDAGELTVWCAQHDPVTLLPAVARNYEMPSYSGAESANILIYLMGIENPTEAVIESIEGGVKWFENYAIEDKALESFINEQGEDDKRIIDATGCRLWGRFVQIEGEIGRRTYDALFEFLDRQGSTRKVEYGGNNYSYHDADNARNSYNPAMAGLPIFCPKASDEGCSYRFAYNFNDTEPMVDANGIPMRTSLNTYDRTTYSFVGTWGEKVLARYKIWKSAQNNDNLIYAINKDDSLVAGTIVELENITLTYGEAGGPDFNVVAHPFDDIFSYYTPGNGINGNAVGGTYYTFKPVCDGVVTAYVKHNLVKPLYVTEDGETMPAYDGITFDDTHPSAYGMSFQVKAGAVYRLFCKGSKLGFFGFVFYAEKSHGIIPHVVSENTTLPTKIFSISGQRLSAPRKGVNIINGKKIIR